MLTPEISAKQVGHIVCFKNNVSNMSQLVLDMGLRHRMPVFHSYNHAMKGFSTKLTNTQISQIMSRYGQYIESIEPDLEVKALAQTVPWGISRIGTPAPTGTNITKDIDIFVLDTGVQITHPDLRIVESRSFVTTEKNVDDLNGHGTAVAGVIAARDNTKNVVGVAPGARIHSYKVMDKNGSGSFSSIIAGVNRVIQWKIANPLVQNKVVINLSLGGFTGSSSYNALDTAILNAIQNNITVVVASGNSGNDAIYYTPAHVVEAITVGAYDVTNKMSSWSNYGSVVDILGPGVNILTTYKGGKTVTISGTSFSSPHVAGAAALYLIKNPTSTPAQVCDALKTVAIDGSNPDISTSYPNTTTKSVFVKNI